MKSFGSIIATKKRSALKRFPAKKSNIDEKTVLFLAERLILRQYGVRGRENIIPKSFKEKRLSVFCRSSLWMNELWMNRDTFASDMNTELGGDFVSDIKIAEMF